LKICVVFFFHKSHLNIFVHKFLYRDIFFFFLNFLIFFFFLIKNFFNFFFFIKKVKFKKKKIINGDILKVQNNINNLFFKIDIEGSEYKVLDELIEIKNKITGIVIEFHDFDLHLSKIENFIKNIGLKLVHIHPNNFGGFDKFGNPCLVELTFDKEPLIINEINTLPHKYDMKNNPNIDDVKLIFQI